MASWCGILLTAIVSGTALAAPITVDSVGTLDPNPNTLTIVDAPSNSAAHGVTLSSFQSLMTSAYANDKGGVVDFQEQFQGGSWPNNAAASLQNGVTVGNGSANAITVKFGVSQAQALSFYRSGGVSGDGIDAAINQGTSVISGGGSARNGSGTSFWDFTNSPPTASAGPAGGNIIAAGGGYMGIAGNAATTLTFNTGLVGFGITGLPRGQTRHTQLTLTLSDNSTIVGSNDVVGTSAVFWGFELTPTEIANGLTISSVAFAHPDGVNRYDDLAFITAVPEAPAFALCGVVIVGAIGLRQGANALGRRRKRQPS